MRHHKQTLLNLKNKFQNRWQSAWGYTKLTLGGCDVPLTRSRSFTVFELKRKRKRHQTPPTHWETARTEGRGETTPQKGVCLSVKTQIQTVIFSSVPLWDPAGCRGRHTWSSSGSPCGRSAAACACLPLAEPPGRGTPRLPAPSTGAPRWGWRARWSSAWRRLHRFQTKTAAALCQPRCWRGPNPSSWSWKHQQPHRHEGGVSHRPTISCTWGIKWIQASPHCRHTVSATSLTKRPDIGTEIIACVADDELTCESVLFVSSPSSPRAGGCCPWIRSHWGARPPHTLKEGTLNRTKHRLFFISAVSDPMHLRQ